MSEERPQQHPKEPAEGGEEDVGAPGADRPSSTGARPEGAGDPPSTHPQEPAEGAEESEQSPGADRPGDGG